MFTRRPRTARDLVSKAGRIPVLAAIATLSLLTLPAFAWAQPAKAGDDKSKAKVTVSEHMTVDLHLKDEDLANVLELLSIQTQKNIVASKGVTGKVTATLYGVTFYQALDAILHVNGYGYMENGNFIYVYTNEELKTIQASLKKQTIKAIRLNYLNADDAKEFVTPLLSKEGGEIKINQKTKDFAIADKTPVGKNDYANSDLLVVKDYEENVKAIEELIKQIDTRPQQVLVEATILQTSLNEANAFGVDFSVLGDLNFVDFINTGGALSAANSLIKGGTGASGQGFSPPGDRGAAITSTVGNTAGQGGFKVGVMAGDVGVFVRMLDSITDTVILSNPKILALNRQPARVLVGKRVGYLNTTQTETSSTQSVEFLDTGTQLYFRPFVSTEGEVRMELKPQVSSAEIRTITDSGGHAVTIPDEVTQEMVTNVNVRDGQTVVLGGLFTDNTTFTRNQVPWMGDLPILGAAFRGKEDSTVRSEIIFLITPTIVTDTLIAGAADRANGDIERVRAGTRQALLPWSREKMTDTLNVEAEKLARDGEFNKALYKIQRSLSLNANQPEVYRLRDRITGQREHWSDPSVLNSYLESEVIKRIESVPTGPAGLPNLKPRGSVRVPMEPMPASKSGASADEMPTGTNAVQLTPILVPGQPNGSSMFSSDSGSQTASGENTAPSSTTPTTTTTIVNEVANTAPSNNTPGNNSPAQAAAEQQAMSPTAENSAVNTDTPPNLDPTLPLTSGLVPAPSNPAASQPGVQTTIAAPAPSVLSNQFPGFIAPMPNAGSVPVAGGVSPSAASSITVTPSTYNPPVLNDKEKKAVADVRQTLPGLRGQIELFGMMNSGSVPQLGGNENNGWGDLFAAQLIKDLPANPYVGGSNSTKVVVGEKPDESFKSNYGWIFNPKTGKLWAAGFDASDRPLAKTATAAAQPAKTEGATAGVETDLPNK